MKKVLFGIVTITALAVYFFQTQPHSAEQAEQVKPNTTEPSAVNKKQPSEDSPLQLVNELKKQISLCRDQSQQQSTKVQTLNQSLVSFFVSELKKGTSVYTLLKYSNLSKLNQRTYIALLKDAIVAEQKQQLNITSSLNELANWQGIEAIKHITNDKVKKLLKDLGNSSTAPPGLTINLPLDENVQKETLYALLSNTDTFTTYVQSFISIEGSEVISPATLFVLNADKLSLKEFEQAISSNQFTVNEVATAIKNGIPNEYIIALLQQVPALDAMPLYEKNTVLYNLADIAVSKFNLPLVKALQTKGITPTNEPGLFTGLDVAIVNLPKSGNLTLAPLDTKHTQLLDYLKKRGYKAHSGNANDDLNGNGVFFVNDFIYQQGAYINKQDNPIQYAYFSPIGKINNSALPQITEPDNSEISQLLLETQHKKEELDSTPSNCSQLFKKLFVAQKLAQNSDAYAKVREIEKEYGSNFENKLQEIDPVLVNFWWNTIDRRTSADRNDSVFRDYLAKKEFQKALEYSQTTPLNQTETNVLFFKLLENPYDLVPIWDNRTLPTPPTNLLRLSWLSLEQWQALAEAGFDFSITDIHGRDVYTQAASSSVEAVQFLIDNKIPTVPSKLGVDILDLALEQSYTKGELTPMIPLALQLVEKFEPNHLARVARLKMFYPKVYQQLIQLNPALKPAQGTKLNHYMFDNH
ncbi:cupric reductase [Pseudoalteromonas carrageenovora]|uniref:cupric reductase n=1 Tax=Pseudoalteromonas carrageenovora TaxID=227 RepID=UPI00312008F9